MPVVMLLVAGAGWVGATRRQRVASLVAVVLLAALAGDLINLHYGYEPTLGDVLGVPLPHQVNSGELRRIKSSSNHGTVARIDIPAAASHFHHRRAMVWLPPRFFARNRPALGVVVMLVGTPGHTSSWLRGGGAGQTADAYARRHGGLAPILVFPDSNGSFTGDTECVDGPRGQAETYLTVDVPAFVRATFGATIDSSRWAIAGLSEGGTCALMLALRHPDVYPTFVDLSGDMRPNVGSPEHRLRVLF